LTLLDDITSVLDDVSVMAKAAAKKTAGVLGDDLALNAQQISGAAAARELPIVWSVAKGSLLNKAILIPAALLISAFAPKLVTLLLMLGGIYLSYEGAEKVTHWLHSLFSRTSGPVPEPAAGFTGEAQHIGSEEQIASEKVKIRGAVRTDFILSAEIIVIALGTIPSGSPLWERASVLVMIGVLMTVGVYGFVAAIVKLDDAGFLLMKRFQQKTPGYVLGKLLVGISPRLMRVLTVAGTAAMFLVGGGILAHGIPQITTLEHEISLHAFAGPITLLLNAGVGLAAGLLALGTVSLFKKAARGLQP
jgi:predicted DNA repair protein MutK